MQLKLTEISFAIFLLQSLARSFFCDASLQFRGFLFAFIDR